MPTFPLPFFPKGSYHEPPRSFGAPREHGSRLHAGCDLYASIGVPVHAVAAGVVVRGPYLFYSGVYALDVRLEDGRIVRYGEIGGAASGIEVGCRVEEGQLIAFVGHILGMNLSMVHFEMFKGGATGRLTDIENPPYYRRHDLIDPTPFLDSCRLLEDQP